MAIPVKCECGRKTIEPDEALGKRFKCRDCGSILIVVARPPAVPKMATPAVVVVEEEEEEEEARFALPLVPAGIAVLCLVLFAGGLVITKNVLDGKRKAENNSTIATQRTDAMRINIKAPQEKPAPFLPPSVPAVKEALLPKAVPPVLVGKANSKEEKALTPESPSPVLDTKPDAKLDVAAVPQNNGSDKVNNTEPEKKMEEFLKEGFTLYNTGDYLKARDKFSEMIVFNDNLPGPYLLRGLCHFGMSDYDNALADFQRTIDLSSKDERLKIIKSKGHSAKAYAYIAKSKPYGIVIIELNEALRLFPENTEALLARHVLNMKMKVNKGYDESRKLTRTAEKDLAKARTLDGKVDAYIIDDNLLDYLNHESIAQNLEVAASALRKREQAQELQRQRIEQQRQQQEQIAAQMEAMREAAMIRQANAMKNAQTNAREGQASRASVGPKFDSTHVKCRFCNGVGRTNFGLCKNCNGLGYTNPGIYYGK